MAFDAKARAEYLKALEAHGGEPALHAGLDLLQRFDAGEWTPAALATPPAPAFKLPPIPEPVKNVLKKAGLCALKCASHLVSKDFAGYAACVLTCVLGKDE